VTDGAEQPEPVEDEVPDGVPALTPRPAPVRLVDDLERALAARDLADEDAGLAGLLRLYARELDGAAAQAARARRVAEDAYRTDPDSALYERVQDLERALSRRQALERIGARFHSGLVELLGTPRARGAGKRPPADPEPADVGQAPGRLGELYLASGGDG